MFFKSKGKQIEVEGLIMYLPEEPDHSLIDGHNLPKKEQYFRRTPLPDWWDELRELEIQQQQRDPDYIDRRCEAFRRQEWKKRLLGYWFFNNGKPTYITGPNYYYWNWCKLNIGYPTPYDFTIENFYFYEYCMEDPKCLGYVVIAGRSSSKTTENVCLQLENMTMMPQNRTAFIQSKDEDFAQSILKEKTITIFNNLPDFFKPVYNHSSEPEKKGMSFFKHADRKQMGIHKYKVGEELRNKIKSIHSGVMAADGRDVHDFINDEIGKVDPQKPIDIVERLRVNLDCVYRAGKKVGILRCITTVEEIEYGKGNDMVKSIWDQSNQLEKNENGNTKIRLYRRFLPAYKTAAYINGEINIDKYGNINQERAKEYYTKEREFLQNNISDLNSYKRKHPFCIEDCFGTESETCEFNQKVLEDCLVEIEKVKNKDIRYGNFEWENIDDKVIWKDSAIFNRDKAKWNITYIPNDNLKNNVRIEGYSQKYKTELKFPQNQKRFHISTDPINKEGKRGDSKHSKPAAAVFYCFDPDEDNITDFLEYNRIPTTQIDENRYKIQYQFKSHRFIADYIHRPLDPEEYYEDMIKACFFFGCKLLPETNTSGIVTYFIKRGYEAFLMKRPEASYTKNTSNREDYGIHVTAEVINMYINNMRTFVQRHGHRFKNPRIVKDLILIRENRTTEYDIAVATCLGLFPVTENRNKTVNKPNTKRKIILAKYDNSGQISTLRT